MVRQGRKNNAENEERPPQTNHCGLHAKGPSINNLYNWRDMCCCCARPQNRLGDQLITGRALTGLTQAAHTGQGFGMPSWVITYAFDGHITFEDGTTQAWVKPRKHVRGTHVELS